jgi:hypothetical protein
VSVSEAEIMQGLLTSIQVVINVFSMFFAMISAYIAALYFFLNRAPLALKLLAFLLLTIGLFFLGFSALTEQRIQVGLFAAWAKLPSATIPVDRLRNPLPVPTWLPPGWSLQDIGVAIGWVTASSVYLALGILTFLYRWEHRGAAARAGGREA